MPLCQIFSMPQPVSDNMLPPSPFTLWGVEVYHAPIPDMPRGARRKEAERQAVAALAREALGPGVTIAHNSHGAPVAAGAETDRQLYLSVSHCRGVAMLAVSRRGPVGIDIAEIRDRISRIAPRFLTAAEERGAVSLPPDRLTCIWTAKEAAFKALGIPDLVVTEIVIEADEARARGRIVRVESRRFGRYFFTLALSE